MWWTETASGRGPLAHHCTTVPLRERLAGLFLACSFRANIMWFRGTPLAWAEARPETLDSHGHRLLEAAQWAVLYPVPPVPGKRMQPERRPSNSGNTQVPRGTFMSVSNMEFLFKCQNCKTCKPTYLYIWLTGQREGENSLNSIHVIVFIKLGPETWRWQASQTRDKICKR